MLQEVEWSIFGLEKIVLRIVDETTTDVGERLRALQAATYLHDLTALRMCEVYEKLQSEERVRSAALYELSTLLSQTLDRDIVLNTTVQKVTEATHAASVAITLRGDESHPLEVGASYRMNPEMIRIMPDICRAVGVVPEHIEEIGAREAACTISEVGTSGVLTAWQAELAVNECVSVACVPMLAARHLLGDLIVCMSEPHDFSPSEVDFLVALAGHAAVAIENAELFEEAKGKRELGLLLEASKLFTSTLDFDEVLRRVAQLAADSQRADHSVVFTPDEARKRLLMRTYYAQPYVSEDVKRRVSEVFVAPGVETKRGAAGQAFATGRPFLISNYAEYPDRIQEIVDITGSLLAIPIRLRDVVIGIFVLVSQQVNAFTEEDLSLAVGLADQAAVSMENARLYERERNIAETFQRTFLPASLPAVPGFELAARYQAALREAEVGGDFYDAFSISGDRIVILVGDVSGKGLSAAAHTAMGKYMMRAYAVENPSPGWVLERFNEAFCEHGPPGLFVTAFYAVLEGKEGTLAYASAGHSQPMLYSKRLDYLTLLDVTGPGLGAVPGAKYGERRVSLEPGDTLLIYTDGATDARRDEAFFGREGLERVFQANLDEPAEQAVDAVFRGILDYCDGKMADDVALVFLKRRD